MKTNILMLTSCSLLITACASNSGANYSPLVDGPYAPSFHADLSACQALARQQSLINGDTQNDMLIGAALGALLGSSEGDAVEGALVGAATGGGSGAYEAHKQRKNVVVNCMRGRGHRVIG